MHGSAPGEKEGRGFGTAEWYGEPLGHNGREQSPSWGPFARGYIVFPSTKDSMGTIEQLFIARG